MTRLAVQPARRAGRRRGWPATLALMLMLALPAGIAAPLSAAPAAWPTRPVQVTMQYSAGSGPDVLLRRLGDALARQSGQPLVVVNKPGANGWLAAADVKRAAADGHTLLVTDNTGVALQPLVSKSMPFDPLKDFEPVTPLYSTYFYVVVAHDAPWRSVGELLDAARRANGTLTAGSFGTASVNHVGIATLQQASRAPMTLVPYKALPDLFNDVSAGRVAWAFGTAATVAPYLQSRRLRLLAVAAPQRSAAHGDVPTVAESGGPSGFELKTWVAVYAPKGTPRAVTERVHAVMTRAMDDAAVRSHLAASGFERWSGNADDMWVATGADVARFAAIVKAAKLQAD